MHGVPVARDWNWPLHTMVFLFYIFFKVESFRDPVNSDTCSSRRKPTNLSHSFIPAMSTNANNVWDNARNRVKKAQNVLMADVVIVPVVCTIALVILLLLLISHTPVSKGWLTIAMLLIGGVTIWLWIRSRQIHKVQDAVQNRVSNVSQRLGDFDTRRRMRAWAEWHGIWSIPKYKIIHKQVSV